MEQNPRYIYIVSLEVRSAFQYYFGVLVDSDITM